MFFFFNFSYFIHFFLLFFFFHSFSSPYLGLQTSFCPQPTSTCTTIHSHPSILSIIPTSLIHPSFHLILPLLYHPSLLSFGYSPIRLSFGLFIERPVHKAFILILVFSSIRLFTISRSFIPPSFSSFSLPTFLVSPLLIHSSSFNHP